MEIRVARYAGFCSGVRRAVDLAMEAAGDRRAPVVTCGPLVHNPQVTELLARRGIRAIDDAALIRDAHVLIRSHGLAPDAERELALSNPILTDATCRKVKRVQQTIAEHAAAGYWIVIAGEPDHAEVRGLLGYANGRGSIVSEPDAVRLEPDGAPVCLVAQTTQEPEWFERIAAAVRAAAAGREVKVVDTICNATRNRQEEAVRLAAEVDRMIVVGGRESGNTRRLVAVVERTGTPVEWIEDETQLDEDALAGIARVGVTAGASTPAWSIQRVVERLVQIDQRSTVRGRMARALRTAVASGAVSSVAAGLLGVVACVLLGARPVAPHALLAALYLFAMQAMNRFAETDVARFRDDPARVDLFARHRAAMRVLAVAAAAGALGIAAHLGWLVLAGTAAFSLLGVAYAYPILPDPLGHRIGVRRLKDLVASKNVVVACAWTTMTVVPPAFAAGARLSVLFWTGVLIALAVGARTIHLDLADAAADRLLGMDTVPTVLGVEKSRALRQGLLLCLVACAGALGAAGTMPRVLVLVALLLAAELVYLKLRGRPVATSRWSTELFFDLHLMGGALLVVALA